MTKTVHPVTDGVTIVLKQRWELEKGAAWTMAWAEEQGFHRDSPESPAAYLLFLAEIQHGMDLKRVKIRHTIDGVREVIDREHLPEPEVVAGRDAEALEQGIRYAAENGTELERMLARSILETMAPDVQHGVRQLAGSAV